MKSINYMFFLRTHNLGGVGGVVQMVLDLVFYLSIVKCQLYDCKN